MAKKTRSINPANVPADMKPANATPAAKPTTPPVVAKNEVDNTARIGELLAELRGKPSTNIQKKIRRKLRSLGHRGGLKTPSTPIV